MSEHLTSTGGNARPKSSNGQREIGSDTFESQSSRFDSPSDASGMQSQIPFYSSSPDFAPLQGTINPNITYGQPLNGYIGNGSYHYPPNSDGAMTPYGYVFVRRPIANGLDSILPINGAVWGTHPSNAIDLTGFEQPFSHLALGHLPAQPPTHHSNNSTENLSNGKRVHPGGESPTLKGRKKVPALAGVNDNSRPVFRLEGSISRSPMRAAPKNGAMPSGASESHQSPVSGRPNTNAPLPTALSMPPPPPPTRPTPIPLATTPPKPKPSPVINRSKIIERNGTIHHDPARFNAKPFHWQPWTSHELGALASAIESSFDASAFARASGKFTVEEVNAVFHAVVTRPLRTQDEAIRRATDGMHELAAHMLACGTQTRVWLEESPIPASRLRGELQGIADRCVVIALAEGVTHPKAKEGVVNIPVKTIMKSKADCEYLKETLSAEDAEVMWEWMREYVEMMRKKNGGKDSVVV